MRGIDICTMSTKNKTTYVMIKIHLFLNSDHSLVELIWKTGWHRLTECHVSPFFFVFSVIKQMKSIRNVLAGLATCNTQKLRIRRRAGG